MMQGRACKQYIFQSYCPITSIVTMHFDDNPFRWQCRKEGKRLKGFRFGIWMVVFNGIMAVKGLIKGTCSSVTRDSSCDQMKLQHNVTGCALSQRTQCRRPTVCEEGVGAERSAWRVLHAAVCTGLNYSRLSSSLRLGTWKTCEALKRVWIVLDNTHVYLIACGQHQS